MYRIVLPILFIATTLANAQQKSTSQSDSLPVKKYVRCINMTDYEQMLEQRDTTRKARRMAAETMMSKWIANQSTERIASVQTEYSMPIVFHVLWNSDSVHEKISLAQIRRQVQVLNHDYTRSNQDAVNTPAAFASVAASFHLMFCLAKTDPSGNPTTGVVYKQTSATSFSQGTDWVKYPSHGGDTIWNPQKYLNIWICNLNGGILGYSELPTSPLDNTFGSVILFQAVGDSGYLPLQDYNLGRTITHEVGHLLNLHHPWGDDGGLCPGSGGTDDGCADTPPEGNDKNDGFGDGGGPTFNAPVFPYTDNCSTVSPGIMFENFMEYTNDNVMNLFTNDQYTIALATIAGPLANVAASSTCTFTGIPEYEFNNSINVYPNPSYTGRFNVSIGLTNFAHINALVYNILGQTVDSWSSDAVSDKIYDLDLSNQPNGLYFVKLYNSDFSIVKKIMINR